jgi:hypothetical protein
VSDISERLIARAVAFEMLNDYDEEDVEFSITSTTTEGNIIYATGEDEYGEHFEFACEVRFS